MEKNLKPNDFICYEEESEKEFDFDDQIPLNGSPAYPRIFIGDSAKPLEGQFNTSEYVDDNITRTWTGILNSFLG